MAGMQEIDANVSSPTKKRDPSAHFSPSQIHKQYWDGVTKRAAAAKPPKSPLPASGGGKNQPGSLSPTRGGTAMSVKLPSKSPLQGMAANVVKGAHNNPLFSDAQRTPTATGWKSITKTEHASKENSAPANTSPDLGRPSPKPAHKPTSEKPTNSLIPQAPGLVTSAAITLTPNPNTNATPLEADTVIDVSAQGVKNRVDYALNTPPNTPVPDISDLPLPVEGVRDNPEYSPSNNPFTPRPEFRRSSITRGSTPGRPPLAAQPAWDSILLNSPQNDHLTEPKTPPKPADVTPPSGGSPQFVEVFLPPSQSERATPRRRLRLTPEVDDVITEDLSARLEMEAPPPTPHPKKSRVRFVLKMLFATVVFMTLGQLAGGPEWIRGPALLGGVAPRGLWQGTPGIEGYNGNAWFSSKLFVSDVEWGSPLKHFIPRGAFDTATAEEALTEQISTRPSLPLARAADASAHLAVIHLSFDEYDGSDNLEEFLPEDKLDSSTEPDPDTDDPKDDVDHHLPNQTPTHYEAPDSEDDVSEASADLSTSAEEDLTLPTDSEIAIDGLDARSILADAQIDDSDVGAADSDTQTGDSDESWAVYDQQLRETALLDMADVAVRSYTSAFLAALALFGVFSFTAFVGAHFYPLPSVADVTPVVAGGDADVADEGEAYAGPPEVTTPMFLRQGVRSEVPALVSPVSASAGSPFGRYQAFVRHMIGQNTEAPQLVLTPVQRSRRLADKFRSSVGSPSHRFTISPA